MAIQRLRELLEPSGSFDVMPLVPGRDDNELAKQNLAIRTDQEMAQRDREAEGRLKMEDELIRGLQSGNPYAIAEMQRRAQAQQVKQLNFKMLIDLAKGDPDTASALLQRLIPGLPQGGSRLDRIKQETTARAEATQEVAANKSIPAKDFGLWVTPEGENLTPQAFKGKTEGDLLEAGAIRLNDAQTARSLAGAKRVLGIGDQIRELVPQVLTKVGKSTLGDIFAVQGNRLAIKSKELAGDPTIRKLQSYLIDYTISLPIAMGLAPGREGPRLLEVIQPGVVHLSDTVESALEVLEANINSVNAAWQHRGIDLYGDKRRENVGKAPQQAIDLLQSNPNLAPQFKEKYGFLPKGF